MSEPFTNPAPTDHEIFPGRWFDIGLEVFSQPTQDPAYVVEAARKRIINALKEQGEDELLKYIK